MKKLLLILFAFAGFDYIAYNLIQPESTFRIIQIIFQVLLCGVTFYFWGWKVVLNYLILWWTFCCDWIYYFIDSLLNLFGTGFEHGAGLLNVIHNHCTWAGWTLAGLLGMETTFITLLIQSLIGIGIVIILILKQK